MGKSVLTPLEEAVLTVSRPLVRLALNRGMAFGHLANLVKRAYVEVVSRDFAIPRRKLTVSRIAVLSGLTRKEVTRQIKEAAGESEEPPRLRFNRAARVLTGWIQDPAYLDGRGGPASLPFEHDSDRSFTDLVCEYGADVTPRAVLDELIRVGAVGRLKDDRIRPLERAYIPQAAEEEKLAILGTDVADLISSIAHNLDSGAESPFFQRKVAYDNLPPEYLPKLQDLVRRDAQKLLLRLDTQMSKHDRDANPRAKKSAVTGRHRAMIGIYYYQDEIDNTQ